MKKSLIPLLVFIALVVFLAIGLRLDPREVPSPLIGKPVPSFSLPLLQVDGALFDPFEMKGKVWVLNVWASWCVACRAEHPVLNRFAQQNPAVILIGLNYKDGKSDALTWLRQFGDPYRFSIVDLDGRVGIDWGVYGVPETFVIDKRGIIREKHIGPVDDGVIRDKLLPLIQKLEREAA